MKLAIVKAKYDKKIRWIYYIVIPILLIILFPFLLQLNPEIITTSILFGIICILSFVFIDKVVDSIMIQGEIKINANDLIINFENQKSTIPYNKIKIIILKPRLGMSRVSRTFKVYDCQIKSEEHYYHFEVTRESVENGKIKARNLMNPKAFDLIRFLEEKKLNHRIEKRIY